MRTKALQRIIDLVQRRYTKDRERGYLGELHLQNHDFGTKTLIHDLGLQRFYQESCVHGSSLSIVFFPNSAVDTCCKTMDGTTSSETQGVDKFPNTNLPKSVNPSVDVVILVFIVVFVKENRPHNGEPNHGLCGFLCWEGLRFCPKRIKPKKDCDDKGIGYQKLRNKCQLSLYPRFLTWELTRDVSLLRM